MANPDAVKADYQAAYLRRMEALKAAQNATDPAEKKAAEDALRQAQIEVDAAEKKYQQIVAQAHPLVRPSFALSKGAQQAIDEANAAYEQYWKKVEQAAHAAEKKVALANQEKKRVQDLKQNRKALTSALQRTRAEQRAKAKAIAHRTHRANYVLSHRFYVEMDGIIRAAFNECSGFGLDVKKEVYLEGGVNDQQRVMLGHAEFQDTVLKRGMTNDPSFWLWMKEVLVGRSLTAQGGTAMLARTRRNINILMMNQAGVIMQVCTLVGAIPVGWKAPAFQADSAAVAIEEMTLAYESIHLQFQTETDGLAAGGATSLLMRDDLGFFPDN